MEKVGIRDRLTVISELTQGRELANELKNQLHPIITQTETCNFLLEKILSSYDNALGLLDLLGNGDPSHCADSSNMLQSPNSIQGSPWSEGSDPDSKDQAHKHVAKKRKLLPKWSKQVRCSGPGLNGQFVDGYNWRKYGQKPIFRASNPRSYYRCTHRHTQGCLATKKVQRTDEDPSILEVIYQGKHSCTQERLKQNKENSNLQKKEEKMISNELALKDETQELVSKVENTPLISFPSTPIESGNLEAHFFSDQSNFTETSYLPPFSSPATPESNFSVNDFGFGNFENIPESDFNYINSNPIPFTNFAIEDMDVFIDQVGFGSHFLDSIDYFS